MKQLIGIIALLFTFGLYVEYQYKIDNHYKEKIYDLQLQYRYVLQTHQNVIDVFMQDVLADSEVIEIITDANNGIDKASNRARLYAKYREHYGHLTEKGILQFHFHLRNGDSFLRFHKPEKFGDNLFDIRPSIQAVHIKAAPVSVYEIGRLFDGFRYVFPMIHNGDIIGTVECSISSYAMLETMRTSLDAKYSMILKRSALEAKIEPIQLIQHFHPTELHPAYMMRHEVYDEEILPVALAEALSSDIHRQLEHGEPFVIHKAKSLVASALLVFTPIHNIQAEHVGYFISNRTDTAVMTVLYEQLLKLLVIWGALGIIFSLYYKNRRTQYLLEQYKNAVDHSTLVSKTDPAGNITYVNDSFEKLSGYTKEELLRKPHRIVRAPEMPKAVFKQMWATIQSAKVWHGKITNRAKDGRLYTVSATIIPITNRSGRIEEYIAIRHDITELEELRELLEHQLDSSIQDRDEKLYLLQQYEEAINSTAVLSRTNPQGKITYINDTYENVSGFSAEEMIGRGFRQVRSPDVPASFYAQMWETIQGNRVWHDVIPNISKSGKPFYLDTTIVPIHDRKGDIREYMAIHYDVTTIYELQQEIVDTQKEVVFTMGAIGESRSKETGNHVKRVAEYSRILALYSGMSEEEAELLKQASPMHDIGKVGIPDDVLNKPGKLDADEWRIMKTHSNLGYQMLKHSDRPILKTAAIVAREHHEKWDGTGYPKGLKGEEIHIYGRITAVADVFDALGSDRVYKEKWNDEQIFNLFKEERGKQFDPQLVDIFFEHLDEFLAVRERFKDV
jgi:PAS domain S-box-containing protein